MPYLQFAVAIFVLVVVVRAAYRLGRTHFREQYELYEKARHDPLTGLLSRLAIVHDELSEDPFDVGLATAVILIDLDGLRELNRIAGHGHGDRALKLFAERAARLAPESDETQLYRWGGDEFLIVSKLDFKSDGGTTGETDGETTGLQPMPDDRLTKNDSLSLARQLVAACRCELQITPSDLQFDQTIRSWPLRISVGVARRDDLPLVPDGNEFDRTVEAADVALRAAKAAGGDRAFLWTKAGPVELPSGVCTVTKQ
jgi:GGDEF domain-containing protein